MHLLPLVCLLLCPLLLLANPCDDDCGERHSAGYNGCIVQRARDCSKHRRNDGGGGHEEVRGRAVGERRTATSVREESVTVEEPETRRHESTIRPTRRPTATPKPTHRPKSKEAHRPKPKSKETHRPKSKEAHRPKPKSKETHRPKPKSKETHRPATKSRKEPGREIRAGSREKAKPTKRPKEKKVNKLSSDEIFRGCCESRPEIPEGCYKYCAYDKVTKGGIISSYSDRKCPKAALQKMFGCAAQLQDNTACCEAEDVSPMHCRSLCPSGVETVEIGNNFMSCLGQVGKFGKCFKHGVDTALKEGRSLGW